MVASFSCSQIKSVKGGGPDFLPHCLPSLAGDFIYSVAATAAAISLISEPSFGFPTWKTSGPPGSLHAFSTSLELLRYQLCGILFPYSRRGKMERRRTMVVGFPNTLLDLSPSVMNTAPGILLCVSMLELQVTLLCSTCYMWCVLGMQTLVPMLAQWVNTLSTGPSVDVDFFEMLCTFAPPPFSSSPRRQIHWSPQAFLHMDCRTVKLPNCNIGPEIHFFGFSFLF